MTDQQSDATSADVLVIGAGVIGLGIAWRCRQRGLSVLVIDPSPGSGASTTAAGLLAPVTELTYGELDLLQLGIDSLRRYPDFAAELSATTGIDVGYRPCGTVETAWDGADLARLKDLYALQTSLGLSAELVTSRELRQLEPALAPGLPGGLLAADDHQVDNRLLHQALLAAVGAHLVGERALEVVRSGDRVSGVRLADGRELASSTVVLAAGSWASAVAGTGTGSGSGTGSGGGAGVGGVPVRPVKGQTLRLRVPDSGFLRHVVRGNVKGSRVYIVPRASGEIVIGASSEEVGFDVSPRAGAIYELLRDAQSLVPELGEARFDEVSTSLRPASPDNAPILGPAGPDGLILAVGHYRNGILLTPVTADAIAELVATGIAPPVIAPFGLERFSVPSPVAP
jgi:glycine oxidase